MHFKLRELKTSISIVVMEWTQNVNKIFIISLLFWGHILVVLMTFLITTDSVTDK